MVSKFIFNKKNRKAQVAIEYMVIIGVLLLFVAGLSAYAFFIYNETIANNQIQESMKDVISASNTVYSLGEGSAIKINITIPEGISQIDISDNVIIITKEAFGNIITDTIIMDANVSGSIPTSVGKYELILTNNNGVVNITEA